MTTRLVDVLNGIENNDFHGPYYIDDEKVSAGRYLGRTLADLIEKDDEKSIELCDRCIKALKKIVETMGRN